MSPAPSARLRGARLRGALLLVGAWALLGCAPKTRPEAPPPHDAGVSGACRERGVVPTLGVQDALVNVTEAQRVLMWRAQLEEQRLLEELNPDAVRAALRVEQREIEEGCLDLDGVVDVGRALFLRTFTRADGLGHGGSLMRFQRGRFGGPDAVSCQSCHWKGGSAGAGDRADNAYLYGDGDDVTTSDVRNPPALWGAGWVELVAREMSADLLRAADDLIAAAESSGRRVSVDLRTKGIGFGTLHADVGANGAVALDTRDVEGVDPDLIVKPFGWKGTFATLREIIGASLQLHLGLQADEVIRAPAQHGVDVGDGPPDDPDGDGVVDEVTEGQVTALVLYLATLDAPPFEAPEQGAYREPVLYSKNLEFVRSPEYTARWVEGFRLFRSIGCASCHVPYLPLFDTRMRTQAPGAARAIVVDLATEGAAPVPPADESGHRLVAAFSDFRRHDLGPGLRSRHEDRGVGSQLWLTRPLWGLSQTSPYLHTGSAVTFDYAIARHGGEAAASAAAYRGLGDDEMESVRFFLGALARAPALRVR